MSITHAEFKEVREEIEAAIVEKASAATFSRSIKWFGAAATVMSFGGWALLGSAYDDKFEQLSRQIRTDSDEQSRQLSAQLAEAQFQLAQIDGDRANIQQVQADVEDARVQSVDALEEIDASLANIKAAEQSVETMQVQYSLDLANLLYTRDRLVSQVAYIERYLSQAIPEQGSLLVGAAGGPDAFAGYEPPVMGSRKIILLRERPAEPEINAEGEETASQAEEGAYLEARIAALELVGLSARLRVALARQGYEVDEWETKAGRPKTDIDGLFSAEAGEVSYPIDQPVLFAHPDFGTGGEPVGALAGYLEKEGALGPITSVTVSGFAPAEGYLGSFGAESGEEPRFGIREVAILYLPLGA